LLGLQGVYYHNLHTSMYLRASSGNITINLASLVTRPHSQSLQSRQRFAVSEPAAEQFFSSAIRAMADSAMSLRLCSAAYNMYDYIHQHPSSSIKCLSILLPFLFRAHTPGSRTSRQQLSTNRLIIEAPTIRPSHLVSAKMHPSTSQPGHP
jgi:hypothetical protein